MKRLIGIGAALTLIAALCLSPVTGMSVPNWPSFRGMNASGIADGCAPPEVWDAKTGKNVAWRTPLPGLGHSSPVVWGDRVFLTTAISSNANPDFLHGLTDTAASASDTSRQRWRVYCLDRLTGKVLWERTAHEGKPAASRHVKASYANSSPATDGRYVVAFFGSEGLHAFDVNGKLLWKQQLGLLDGGWTASPELHFGFASSPILFRNLAIVQCDAQNQSFIAAFNLSDGKEVWRVPRGEDTSWSTPSIVETTGDPELITSGTRFYRGYDPLTGKELWRLPDGIDVKIPTPIAADGLVYLGGGSTTGRRIFYALHSGLRGEVKPSASDQVAWQSTLIKPHIVTPIVYRNGLYVCTDNGILTQYSAKTGDPVYRARLGSGGAFSASPVASDGRIYFSSEEGEVFVVRAGSEFELIAQNRIDEVMMATPAIAERMLILRAQNTVFAVSSRPPIGPAPQKQ